MPVISTIAAATARAFGAFKSAAGGAADEFFKYVTLLLHGDGTNGAQNNTFLDSSTNNFTITRNGNTTQGTFSPFSQTGWSNYFDGSGDYLTLANNSALDMGTGDFTFEFWVYSTDASQNTQFRRFIATGTNSTSAIQIGHIGATTGVVAYTADDTAGTTITGTTNILNQWTHIAVVRQSNTVKLYVNGVSEGTPITDSNSKTTSDFTIGKYPSASGHLLGYMSNVRVVKGTAVYTANFTPSTTPLTAITNTSLLTCQSNRFVDNSSNAFAITVNGNTSVQAFSPFAPTAAYSAATVGGSGYFDGSGDYLATSSTQVIPTGSFTVECFVFVTGSGSNQKFISQGSSGSAGRFSLGIEGGNWFVQIAGSLIQTGTPVRDQWNYVAATYNGSTLALYVNGTSIGTVAASGNVQNSALTIGQDWNSYTTTGYIGPVRISNTVRTVTSVPTAPWASDANTTFLANFTNGGIIDNTAKNNLETVGNAQISTSVKKYGTGSLAFDGSGDYLKPSTLTDLAFGTGDFTIEFWLYLNTTATEQWCVAWTGPSTCTIYFNSGTIRWFANGGLRITGASLSATTWYHIALTRENGSTKLFVDGIQSGSTYADTNSYVPTAYAIGATTTGTASLNGYIDDLRITKGVARYTANFTAPTAAFADQ